MSSPVTHSLGKPPADRTLVIASVVLGGIAAIQLLAAVAALLPEISVQSFSRSTAASAGAEAAATPAPTQAAIESANSLLAEAEEFGQEGNLQGMLEALTEAERILPNEPGVLLQIAMVQQQLGRPEPALETIQRLQQVLALPATRTNPAFDQIERGAAALLSQLEAAPAAEGEVRATQQPDTMMRDNGIPIGAVMGIVESRVVNGEPGFKELRVATKASSKVEIAPEDLKVVVYFYEQSDSGDIIQTDSKLMSEWLTPPTDWANGDPELLTVKYPLPLTDRGDLPPLQYYGYVLGIYYKNELQDWRGEPVELLDTFPLKLSIEGGQ